MLIRKITTKGVALGVDFGTTRVKATAILDNGTILNTYSVSWIEASSSKYHLSDWLKIFEMVVNGVFEKIPLQRKNLIGLSITTIAPCCVVIDEESGTSSTMILYEEEIPKHSANTTRKERTLAAFDILRNQVPKISNSSVKLLSANAWLGWKLTDVLYADYSSLTEFFGSELAYSKKQELTPKLRVSPSTVIGEVNLKWRQRLSFEHSVVVSAGGSDSFGLARAADLKPTDTLVYLGTFFSVMESQNDFNKSFHDYFPHLPYDWHISLPGGAILERLASSYYDSISNRTDQIKRLFYLNDEEGSLVEISSSIELPDWSVGISGCSIPVFLHGKENWNKQELAIATIDTFIEAVKLYISNKEISKLKVTGGLSNIAWVSKYFKERLGVDCCFVPPIIGAEGSAKLVLDGLRDEKAITNG